MTKKKANGTAPPPVSKPTNKATDDKKAGNKKDNMKLTVGDDNKRKK
jgi:hypothetical protein